MQLRFGATRPTWPVWCRRGQWRRRGVIRCEATPEKAQKIRPNRQGEATEDFTPFTMVEYEMKPEHFCKHSAEVKVQASPESCFAIWNQWGKLLDFLDLIGEVFTEPDEPEAAALLIYYRFDRYPLLQILTNVEKSEVEENAFIKFRSTAGMPLRGMVEFVPAAEGGTNVRLRFEHALPSNLLVAKIGVYTVENHMRTILEENMATFKMLAEGDLEFWDHSNDHERILKRYEEIKDAYYSSEYLSEEEPYEPSDIADFARPVLEHEMFPDGM